MNRWKIAVASGAMVLLSVGCSAIPGNAPRVPLVTPQAITGFDGTACSLVTDSFIAGVMGKAPMSGGGMQLSTGGLNQCVWTLWLQPAEQVSISVLPASDYDSMTYGGERIALGDAATLSS